jgi:glycosyltransferase involved in cell wall biosynthesis
MKKIIFLASHPTQYAAPLYAEMEKSGYFDLKVWFCSHHGIDEAFDRQFGTTIKWDIPLLEGYKYAFLANAFGKASVYGFWGLRNIVLIKKLYKEPKSTVIVHGWNYFTTILALLFGKLLGHNVYVRGESPFIHEPLSSKRHMLIRRLRFSTLFRFVDKFLYVGEQNKQFYEHYGVDDKDLIFIPYTVDNSRFQAKYEELKPFKEELRKKWAIPTDKKIIIASGKLTEKKRPLDLIEAFAQLKNPNAYLVFMGDGELRADLEAQIKLHQLEDSVKITGFINQSVVPEFYALADLYTMPSGWGETWGLSTNEAMNFHLPVIVSNMCGSAYNLVEEGKNGYTFQSGNVEDLSRKMKQFFSLSSIEQEKMGDASVDIINGYSYKTIIENLNNLPQ